MIEEGLVIVKDGILGINIIYENDDVFIPVIKKHCEKQWLIQGRIVGFRIIFQCYNYNGEHLDRDCSCKSGDIREEAYIKYVRAHKK